MTVGTLPSLVSFSTVKDSVSGGSVFFRGGPQVEMGEEEEEGGGGGGGRRAKGRRGGEGVEEEEEGKAAAHQRRQAAAFLRSGTVSTEALSFSEGPPLPVEESEEERGRRGEGERHIGGVLRPASPGTRTVCMGMRIHS